MNQEIEATFLNMDYDTVRQRLMQVGAKCEKPQHDMFRVVYDYPDLRLDKIAAWVRVRREGDKITMTFKHRQAETIEGMKEVELVVSSYDDACAFLEAIGLVEKARQETRREVWRLDECEIMLDEWPWIPPYIEVEGPSEIAVKAASKKLGFDYGAALFDSADGVYQEYFDVTRTEISTVPITFGPVPDWLEAKRR
ncbi:MAG: CYTH domain-containing protein [Candidatus Saccharimonadales bacterium]